MLASEYVIFALIHQLVGLQHCPKLCAFICRDFYCVRFHTAACKNVLVVFYIFLLFILH